MGNRKIPCEAKEIPKEQELEAWGEALDPRDKSWRCWRCDHKWKLSEGLPNCNGREEPIIAPNYLEAGAETFRQRNAIYGNNYQRFGAALIALFPEGGVPAITTEREALRLNYIVNCLCKLQRYAHNFSRGGHADSAHDLMVYAAMLEEMTDEK